MGGIALNNQVDEKVESGVRQIIERAVKSGAEAVHIEPRANFVVVRFRCGGLLSVANKLPKSSAKQLSRHLKNLAGLKVSKTKMPQEASFSMKIGRQNYSLRLATLPIVDGEKLTINIQPEVAKRSPSLEDLGLWGDGLRALDHALAAPHGLVLLGSIQASYAAPTLTAMLDAFGPLASKLFFSETAAAAGEGIRPVVLNQEFGLDLSHHFKRLNQPDFSVIAAEVRGAKSAAAAAKLGAKADHLLIASLPAGSAVAAFNFWHRAVNNPALILNVRASIAQVFVRGLCPDCCETYQLDGLDQKNLAKCFDINSPAAVKRIHVLEKSAAAKLNSKLPLSSSENRIHQLWRADAAGCSHCNFTGYKGTIGLFEVCDFSQHMQTLLAKNSTARQLQAAALAENMVSLPMDGLIKTLHGLIDLKTLLEVCRRYDADFR